MLSGLHISQWMGLGDITILFIVSTVVYLAVQRFQKGLSKYPGPFIASLTHVWRAVDMSGRSTQITYRQLHAKYGDVVRVGPNVLSFGDPAAIRDIYGLNKGYTKVGFELILTCSSRLTKHQSGYYDVFATVNKGNIIYNLYVHHSQSHVRCS